MKNKIPMAGGLGLALAALTVVLLSHVYALPGLLLAFPVMAVPEAVKKLRQRVATASDEMVEMLDAIEADGRDPTEDEDYQAKKTEYSRLQSQLAEREELEEERARLTQPATEPEGPTAASRQRVEVGEDREALEPFGSIGEQMHAIAAASDPEVRALGQVDKRLLHINAEHRAATGMSEGVPADGGFAVQKNFISEILERVWDQGQILSRIQDLPIGENSNGIKLNAVDETSRADGSRWGGVRAYWENEADSTTASKPKLRQMELALNKLFALVYSTTELQEDAPALTSLVQRIVPEELTFKAEDAVVNGTGAGMPLGVTASDALISVSKETSQAADTVVAENLSKMKSRMWTRSRMSPGLVWLINQDVEPQLDKLHYAIENKAGTENVGGFTAPIYIPAGARGNEFALLHGKPVLPVEYCATVGTVGDILHIDLREYLLIMKQMRAAASMHVRFLYDELTYRFIWRLDGQPAWNSAVTPKNGTNTLSPFVALASRD